MFIPENPLNLGILKGGETRDEDGDRALSTLGDNLGMGTTQILGIYWGLSLKNPKFWGWGRSYSS